MIHEHSAVLTNGRLVLMRVNIRHYLADHVYALLQQHRHCHCRLMDRCMRQPRSNVDIAIVGDVVFDVDDDYLLLYTNVEHDHLIANQTANCPPLKFRVLNTKWVALFRNPHPIKTRFSK